MSKKLPKHIAQMVEKNNMVLAIKTMVDENKLSFEDAKAKVDAYEQKLKAKQKQKINTIAKKQGVSAETNTQALTKLNNNTQNHNQNLKQHSSSNTGLTLNQNKKEFSAAQANKNSITAQQNHQLPQENTGFNEINKGLDNHLNRIGYKKPFLPHLSKRLIIVILVCLILGLLIWRLIPS